MHRLNGLGQQAAEKLSAVIPGVLSNLLEPAVPTIPHMQPTDRTRSALGRPKD
jgi:hypothetical protein